MNEVDHSIILGKKECKYVLVLIGADSISNDESDCNYMRLRELE